MKKTAFLLACFFSILLFTATPSDAAEQKIVFNTEKLKYESGTGPKQCQDKCNRRSGPDVNLLLSEGWKIIGSSPKEVVGENYRYAPCNTCEPHGCVCIGTEYVLRMDTPAAKVETSSTGYYTPSEVPQIRVESPKDEPLINEIELLKKKNELLLREISILRRENEELRNQLKSR
jgi:hypothetical protein